MDYRAESDPTLHSSGSDRMSQPTPNLTPPAAPPRAEDPRVARVRTQLELAVRQLEADITGLQEERDGLEREIAKARQQRERLRDLAALEPAVLDHLLAVLGLEGPAGDAPEDPYDEHLAEALRHA